MCAVFTSSSAPKVEDVPAVIPGAQQEFPNAELKKESTEAKEETKKDVSAKPVETEAKIDEKDRIILKLLMEDARMPMITIAKETGLSHDAIKYRIERLKKSGVITQFTTVLNPAKLGFGVCGCVAFSLQNHDKEKFGEFGEFMKQHRNVSVVRAFSGRWDYFIEIYAKDLAQFNEIFNEIKIKFSGIIKDSETLFVMKDLKLRMYPNIF